MEEKEYSMEYVKYILNDDEKKEIAITMAQKVTELNQAEDDKKSVVSDFKSRIDGLQAEVNRSATLLNNGYEMRNIKCEVIPFYSEKVFRYMRTDNGEIAKERKMTSDDMQRKIIED